MRINIVTEKSPGWVLRRISEEYQKRMPDTYITDIKPDGNADVNLYINYALMKEKTGSFDVAWFTHKENSDFDRVAGIADMCVAMCNKTALLLPENKTVVIKPCADKQFFRREMVFGCVGREYKTGRKGYQLIEEIRKIEGLRVLFTNQKYMWRDLPDFYRTIDYLLVLSKNEGGPMPVLEAIASGIPVIAPNVGWCWDYPVIKYSGTDNLMQIIRELTPKDEWEASAFKMHNTIRYFYKKAKHEVQLRK